MSQLYEKHFKAAYCRYLGHRPLIDFPQRAVERALPGRSTPPDAYEAARRRARSASSYDGFESLDVSDLRWRFLGRVESGLTVKMVGEGRRP